MKSLFKYLITRLPFYIFVIALGSLIYSNKVYEITYSLCSKSIVTRIVLVVLAVLSTILVVRGACSKDNSWKE